MHRASLIDIFIFNYFKFIDALTMVVVAIDR